MIDYRSLKPGMKVRIRQDANKIQNDWNDKEMDKYLGKIVKINIILKDSFRNEAWYFDFKTIDEVIIDDIESVREVIDIKTDSKQSLNRDEILAAIVGLVLYEDNYLGLTKEFPALYPVEYLEIIINAKNKLRAMYLDV
jgi:hypothetical protein